MSRGGRGPSLWDMPAVLGLLSGVGLVAALLWGGWGDAVSWAGLAAPVAVSLVIGFRAALPARPRDDGANGRPGPGREG